MNLLEIGKVIKDRRKKLKISQVDLAKQVGISRTTLSGLEGGSVDEIGLRRVIAICAHLGLTIEVVPSKSKRPTLDDLVKEQRDQIIKVPSITNG